jgi:hypothetical protein
MSNTPTTPAIEATQKQVSDFIALHPEYPDSALAGELMVAVLGLNPGLSLEEAWTRMKNTTVPVHLIPARIAVDIRDERIAALESKLNHLAVFQQKNQNEAYAELREDLFIALKPDVTSMKIFSYKSLTAVSDDHTCPGVVGGPAVCDCLPKQEE